MAENIDLTIQQRFIDLALEGDKLLSQVSTNEPVSLNLRPSCVSWLLSTVNLLEVALPSDSRHRREAQRLLPKADEGIWPRELASILGILKSAAAEWTRGLINTLEFKFVGLAFEDFLRHAAVNNQEGRKMEAAVLASAVLEDTVKKLCRRHNIDPGDNKLDTSITALKSHQVISKVKAERLRSYAALRNQALHANWEAFDKRDVHQMIEGLEELIEAHFT